MRKSFDVLVEGRFLKESGGGGIRTLERPSALPVFKTGAIGRSATTPGCAMLREMLRFFNGFRTWALGQSFAGLPIKIYGSRWKCCGSLISGKLTATPTA